MKKIAFLIYGVTVGFMVQGQTEHLTGQTKLVNPSGRTLVMERDDEDSWFTFHDPGQNWYSMGIDRSNNGSLSLNSGAILNSTQFVMNKNGDVGIGTSNPGILNTNPSYQIYNSNDIVLDIQGNNNRGWISTGSNINDGILGGIAFTKPNGQADAHRQIAYIRVRTNQSSLYTPESSLEFASKGAGFIGDPDMVINPRGNVGIGTSSPGVFNSNPSYQIYNSNAQLLDVQGGTRPGWISTGSNIDNGVLGGIAFTKPNGQADAHRQVAYIRVRTTQSSVNTPLSTLEFASKGAGFIGDPDMVITPAGSLGIGTLTTGTHKLAVDGSIGAREIKVEVGDWSDFVFEKDYQLKTLEEVEIYVNQNKHLPEIPSEAEVTENGVNLGEMDAKLLQKIEELTLYMIDLNKQVQELKQENVKLKSKSGR